MSKNLTRKGLALGAAIALVGSALVASPAQAAVSITLDSKFGTVTSVPATAGFAILSTLTDTPAANTQLKWKVVDASAGLATSTEGTTVGRIRSLRDAAATAAAAAPAETVASVATAAPTAEGVSVVPSSGSAANTDYSLKLFPAADASFSVTVQAWLDRTAAGTVGAIDGGELTSSVITINFVKTSDITWAVNFTKPAVGDAKLMAAVTSTPAVNFDQIAGSVGVNFLKDTAAATAVSTAPHDLVSKNATTGAFEANPSALAAVTGESLYTAQAYFGALVGAVSSFLTDAAAVHAVGSATTTENANFKLATDTYTVRSGTTTVPVSVAVLKAANTAAGAGIPVEVTVTSTVLATGSTVTAGGKTLTATTGAASSSTFNLVTNSDGKVVFDITTVGAKASDAFTVSAKAEGEPSTTTRTYQYADATFVAEAIKNLNLLGTAAALKAVKGSSYTLNFAIVDQWGFPTSVSDLRVKVVQSVAANNQTRYGAVTNGLASVSLPVAADSTDGTTITNTATLEKLTSGAFTAVADATSTNTPGTVIGASTAASAVTVTGNTSAETDGSGKAEGDRFALNLKDFASADTRIGEASPAGTLGVTVGGQVNDSLGQGTYSTVTLSGSGLLFAASGKFSVGSITVQTDASGAYAGVAVYSNTSGLSVLTVVAGSATKTTNLYFKKAEADTGTVLVISAPDSILPGSTLSASVKLTDKYGNPVAMNSAGVTDPSFSFSAVSPGIQVGSNPTGTDADGVAKLAFFLGNNDSGSITLTATYDADGTGTAFKPITVIKTIVIGAASGNVGDYSSWTKKLDDGSAKMYAKNLVGAGKVQFFLNGREIAWVRATSASDRKLLSANGANYMVRTVTFAAGKNVLEIYVDGVRTTRTAYTKR